MKEIEPDEKVHVGLYLSFSLLERIREEATKEDRSVNNIVVKTLREAFMPELMQDANSSDNTLS